MTITIREEQDRADSGAQHTFTLTTAQVGDTVVLIQASNFHGLANLITPTGTAVTTWVQQTSANVDGGGGRMVSKTWVGTVTTAGGTVSANRTDNSDEGYAAVLVLVDAAFDTAAGTDGLTASTSHVAPSVTPTTGKTDDLLVCVFGAGNAASYNYTMPGGMTAYTERDIGSAATYRAASEQLASDAATGTRTATASASVGSIGWFAVSVLMKSTTAPPTGPFAQLRPAVVAP
jgi:hypothetical protein